MQSRSADDALFFVTTADAGSLASAARRLGLAASTLSRRLSALEQRLGVKLVERTTRSLRLTEPGRAYLDRARAMAEALADAESIAKSYGSTPRGTLRIAAPPVLGAIGLGSLLARYAQRCPEVEVEVMLGERPVDLRAERFDAALRLGLPLPDGSDLVRRVGVSPRVLCASPAYLLRQRAPKTIAELREHALIDLGSSDHAISWSFSDGSKLKSGAWRSRVRVNSSMLARETCRAGAGLSLLPRFLVREDLAAGDLVELTLEAAPKPADVYLLLAAAGARTIKVRVFVELIDRLPRDAVKWVQAASLGRR